MQRFKFTYRYLENQLEAAQKAGYKFISCEDYFNLDKQTSLSKKTIVLRVDIDLSCKKALRLAQIFTAFNLKASFFVRLHAPEYNPFSFENYRILKLIRDSGFEIGYHSEIVDQAEIWEEDAGDCLSRDIEILNRMLGVKVKGVASHGGMTGLNNLDFWKNKKASDFGLSYEAYEASDQFNLFKSSLYLSDSEWTRWKCYKEGSLVTGDRRSLSDHVEDEHPLIYLLIHPDTFFDNHAYE